MDAGAAREERRCALVAERTLSHPPPLAAALQFYKRCCLTLYSIFGICITIGAGAEARAGGARGRAGGRRRQRALDAGTLASPPAAELGIVLSMFFNLDGTLNNMVAYNQAKDPSWDAAE